jgi:hypothetical protein
MLGSDVCRTGVAQRRDAVPRHAELRSPSRLQRIARVAEELGLRTLAVEAESFARRVAEGLCYVACVGQFKRGKSTLLNALIQDALLPTGVVPVTSVVTVVRHGRERRARIHLRSGVVEQADIAELPGYVTEAGNPRNAKGVAVAEVFVPSDLLVSGGPLLEVKRKGASLGDRPAARAEHERLSSAVGAWLRPGFCGGFTTMSTFSYETLSLLRDGERPLALGIVGATLAACFGAVSVGNVVARLM